jgi:hypothetical protein
VGCHGQINIWTFIRDLALIVEIRADSSSHGVHKGNIRYQPVDPWVRPEIGTNSAGGPRVVHEMEIRKIGLIEISDGEGAKVFSTNHETPFGARA